MHLLVSEQYIDSTMHGATIRGTNPVFYGDTSCLQMFQFIVPVEVMFDDIFKNDCVSSVCGTIGMLCVVYCVFWNFNVAFRGEMLFRNQHDVFFLVLYVGFDFCSMLGKPSRIP